ncbi:uncharacterized protein LOC142929361 [Petromyzon marinus]|uniref:uncharacterized protein LOC142929361 n=1 Tax=Petromyzon marinus TaxID=7757 RepID=UPI003F70560C
MKLVGRVFSVNCRTARRDPSDEYVRTGSKLTRRHFLRGELVDRRLDGKAAAAAAPAPSARGRRWRRLQAPGRPRWRRERRQQQQRQQQPRQQQPRQPPPPLLRRLPTPRSQRLSQQQRLQQQRQKRRQLRPRNVNGCLVAGLRAPHNTTQFLMRDEYRRERLRGDFAAGPAAPRDAGDLDGYSRALERARGGCWGGALVVPIWAPRGWSSSAAGDGAGGVAEGSYEPADEDWSRTEDFMERDFAAVYREAGCA